MTNLLTNPGFETGDFTGWTVTVDPTWLPFMTVTSLAPYVHSGTYGAALGPEGVLGYLSQTITTVPGTNYTIKIWLETQENTQTTDNFVIILDGTIAGNVVTGGTTLLSVVYPNFLIGYATYSVNFLATSTHHFISFGFRNDGFFFGFDDGSILTAAASGAGQSRRSQRYYDDDSPYVRRRLFIPPSPPPPPPPVAASLKWLSPVAVQQYWDNASHLLIGGSVLTQTSGMMADLSTFTDSFGVTPNTDPVLLDARGEAQIWLPAGSDYDMTLFDPNNSGFWTVTKVSLESPIYWPKVNFTGTPSGSQIVGADYAITSIAYPAAFAGSRFYAKTAPTLAYSLIVYQDGVPVGAVNFAAGANIATFTTVGLLPVNLIDGSRFELIGQVTADATIAGIYGTFAGQNTISGWP